MYRTFEVNLPTTAGASVDMLRVNNAEWQYTVQHLEKKNMDRNKQSSDILYC